MIEAAVLRSCGVALRRMGEGATKSIAVTSTTRGEGRTTTALGLATAAATEGRRTILLEMDLLHGDLYEKASVAPEPGVIEYLELDASLDDILQPVTDQLSVVTAGVASLPNDAVWTELLSIFIEELSARCDVLVADLPALDDGVAAARMTDLFTSVVMVVRSGGVEVSAINASVSMLEKRPFIIFNGTGKQPTLLRRLLGRRP